LQEDEGLFQIPKREGGEQPVYFTGEMVSSDTKCEAMLTSLQVYPWMFEDYAELARLKDQAEMVAKFDDWPQLFDLEQLKRNEVPVYAAVFTEDMYVDFDLSMRTAQAIKGCRTYITNLMYHDAVRSKMDEVFKALFALRDDSID
jgi:hypothetical protein